MNNKKLGWLSAIIGTTLVIVATTTVAGAEEYEVTAFDCDFNNDCIVDSADHEIFQEAWYDEDEANSLADLNQDGFISLDDLSEFQHWFGQEVPNCPPEQETEQFVVEEYWVDFSVNYTMNTIYVTDVSGNISWDVAEVIVRNGELLQQPTTENITEQDLFMVSEGNLTIRYPKTNDPNETEYRGIGRMFSAIVEEEPEPMSLEECDFIPDKMITCQDWRYVVNNKIDVTNDGKYTDEDSFYLSRNSGYYFEGFSWGTAKDADLNNDYVLDAKDLERFNEIQFSEGIMPDINKDGMNTEADALIVYVRVQGTTYYYHDIPELNNTITPPEPETEPVNETMEPPIEEMHNGHTLDEFDFTDDGVVDCDDIALFKEHWYDDDGSDSIADITNDGIIDLDDLSEFTDTLQKFDVNTECNEPEPEPVVNETEQQNETVDPLEQEINNIETNITQLEAEKEYTILLRDAFSRALNRWQKTMSKFLINHAYDQIENVFNAKINAIDNEINSLNGQLLQLLSEQAETFIPNEG